MSKVIRKPSEDDLVTDKADEAILQLADFDLFPIDPEVFREMVAERAYFKAEHRDFEPGHEWDDWLEAEKELLGIPHSCSKGMD